MKEFSLARNVSRLVRVLTIGKRCLTPSAARQESEAGTYRCVFVGERMRLGERVWPQLCVQVSLYVQMSAGASG